MEVRPPLLDGAVPPLRWAAPSFVMAGTVAENVRFTKGQVPEMALCLFETAGCLAYTEADLPAAGERLGPGGAPMRFHAHLPVDLPWEEGASPRERGGRACETALAVLARVADLEPCLCVLHPPCLGPDTDAALLDAFLERWTMRSAVPVLLENIGGAPLFDLPRSLFGPGAYGVCLDAGHLMGYHQEPLMDTDLPGLVRLMHWSAPGGGDRHRPLTEFTAAERQMALRVVRATPPEATQLIEVFNWEGVRASLPVLEALWAEGHGDSWRER